jgi:integrase
LKPYLDAAGKKYLFRPEEAMSQREKGSGRTKTPRYTKDTYRRAVQYAFDAARKENATLPPEQRKTLIGWTPHQLRHEFITRVKRAFGAETARAAGGHSSLDATEIYIEKDLQAAMEAAKQLG